MADLKIGDRIQLKSGGPTMTVNYVTDEIYCVYFHGPEFKEIKVFPNALKKLD